MYETSQKNKNLALFDFDGTLCNKDSFTGFFFYTLPKRHIIKRGIKIIPWIVTYYAKLYPAHLMRPKLFQAMLKNMSTTQIEPIALEYAQYILKENLNTELYQQLKYHQILGDDIVLVSASVDVYLQYIAKALNIDLICSTAEIKNRHYTGQYVSQDCSFQQKKLRVLEQYQLDQYQSIYAYGNSLEDLAMLDLADFPYLITTKRDPLPQLMTI